MVNESRRKVWGYDPNLAVSPAAASQSSRLLEGGYSDMLGTARVDLGLAPRGGFSRPQTPLSLAGAARMGELDSPVDDPWLTPPSAPAPAVSNAMPGSEGGAPQRFALNDAVAEAGRYSEAIPTPPPTTTQNIASRFAGARLVAENARQGLKAGEVALGSVTVLGAGLDLASIVASNEGGVENARMIARQMFNNGIQDYDLAMAIAQKDAQLESAIGNIGASDYAKTLVGAGLNIGDIFTGGPLALATVPLGVGSYVDAQGKKNERNRAFREEFQSLQQGRR